MSVLEVDDLLGEISPEQPSGEDLEYDAAFGELERSAEGKPEQQFGDTIIPAEDPDWREVRKNALAVLSRSHDLRAAVYLARAVIRTDGLPGLRDALAVIHGFVERYWETVHPQLDPDDDNDPTLRVNTLTALCDASTVIRAVREAPLVSSRALGRYSMRDIAIAKGEITPASDSDEPVPQMAAIEGAFMDSPIEDLQATAAALDECIDFVQKVEATVTDQVGAANAPSLNPLVGVLRDAQHVMAERLAQRGVGEAPAAPEGAPEGAAAPGAPAAGGGAAPKAMAGEITSREDVVRVLDKICAWYGKAEPSSPVPLLLRRAKRLVTMDFMDIVRDLAPEGLSQVEKIRGEEPGE